MSSMTTVLRREAFWEDQIRLSDCLMEGKTSEPTPLESIVATSPTPNNRSLDPVCGSTPSPVTSSCRQQSPPSKAGANGFSGLLPPDPHAVTHPLAQNSAPTRASESVWSYQCPPDSFPSPLNAGKPPSAPNSSALNGDFPSNSVPAAMFADSALTDYAADVQAATKLFQTGGVSQYYSSAVYNSPSSLPYGIQGTAGLYTGQQQSYYAATRGLKAPVAPNHLASSYPIAPYFTSHATPCAAAASYYGGAYCPAPGSTLDYPSPYATYPTSSQYYSGTYAYANPTVTTTTTYQLAQLPPCTSLAGTASDSTIHYSLNDLSPFQKPDTKKSKSKKKKQNPSPSPEGEYERVFIWEQEDACILFNSLRSGAYAAKFEKESSKCYALGTQMETLMYYLAETHLFLNDLEDCDQAHLDDVGTDDGCQDLTAYNFTADGFQLGGGASLCLGGTPGMRGGVDWMRKLAVRYRRIRETYAVYKENVDGLLGPNRAEQWRQLRAEIEAFTDSWHTLALKCLHVIASKPRYANVLVTEYPLVLSSAKTLLYGLGSVFPIENIYSVLKIGREACFEKIQARFGKKCTYVVVGPGREEETVAKQMQLPFWRVTGHSDLAALHHALDLGHL